MESLLSNCDLSTADVGRKSATLTGYFPHINDFAKEFHLTIYN